jgi:2-oxoglutarate ferredoxin oxidoreductase subunit beta
MEQKKPKKPAGPPARKPKGPGAASVPSRPAAATKPTLPPGAPSGDSGPLLSRKDFQTDQDVRWCPGCGDYAILAQVQRTLPDLGVPRENIVFISGIGCSSRFPYYMETYGMHSIHGRAPAIATGLKSARPELDVWIVTGDGDGLSIGGNHIIHILRRNVDVQILLFNNQIYGLTKGQYSPTSEKGKVTKSTPFGSIDYPFNPAELALGASSSFVARTVDRDPKHMGSMLKKAHAHHGASFVEIYQNCNIFNDGAFFTFTDKSTKAENAIFLEHEKPMTFDEGRKGIRIEGYNLHVVDLESGKFSVDDCLIYNETSLELAGIAARMQWQPHLPRPFGVFYREDRPTYEAMLQDQIQDIVAKRGKGDLQKLLQSGQNWVIE